MELQCSKYTFVSVYTSGLRGSLTTAGVFISRCTGGCWLIESANGRSVYKLQERRTARWWGRTHAAVRPATTTSTHFGGYSVTRYAPPRPATGLGVGGNPGGNAGAGKAFFLARLGRRGARRLTVAGVEGLRKAHAIRRWDQLPVPNGEGPPSVGQSCGSGSRVRQQQNKAAPSKVRVEASKRRTLSHSTTRRMTHSKLHLTAAGEAQDSSAVA